MTDYGDRTITTSILGLASGPSRLSASLRPRSAGLTALTGPSLSPVLGIYVMARQTTFHRATRSHEPARRWAKQGERR